MTAGRDISNVDAVIPTNARMAGKDSFGNAIAPDANNLIELAAVIFRSRPDAISTLEFIMWSAERGRWTSEVKSPPTQRALRRLSI